MNLLKPLVVTLPNNIDSNGELIDETLIGETVMGWVEPVVTQNEESGEQSIQHLPKFAVVWLGQTNIPATSVYFNHELAVLGLADTIDDTEETDEEENDVEYETDDLDFEGEESEAEA